MTVTHKRPMVRLAVVFASAFLFAIGLGLSGMMRPAKVQGFLDVFGIWDPTLVFVMAAAVGTYGAFYPMIRARARPVHEPHFHIPSAKKLDGRLLLGATIFGVGWGLAGYCPGPALGSLVEGGAAPAVFVASMAIGMGLFSYYERLASRRRSARDASHPIPA